MLNGLAENAGQGAELRRNSQNGNRKRKMFAIDALPGEGADKGIAGAAAELGRTAGEVAACGFCIAPPFAWVSTFKFSET